MKTFFLLISCVSFSAAFAQAPVIKWQHTYGGSGFDQAHAIDLTSDGGYIVAGLTTSDDGEVTNYHFQYDYWVVKINSSGKIQWESAFGGGADDVANDVHQTKDGGYIVAGFSESGDGDLKGAGGHGDADFWVLKLDANGNKEWSKEYGGIGDDVAHSIQQTSDGGYIVAGETLSPNIQGEHGGDDYLVVKIDSLGNLQWEKAYGGTGTDFATAVIQLSDGSYLVGGSAGSTNGQVTNNHGNNDYWVLHLDSGGNIIWQKTYGGSGLDNIYAISDAGNGQFYIAGSSYSNDDQVTGSHGGGDYWIIKIDTSGTLIWQKDFGGSNYDQPSSIVTTSDGGCFISGMSSSTNGDVTGNRGFYDFWLMKLKSNGSLQWQETLGGSSTDEGFGGRQLSNGNYIVAGYTLSNDDEVTHNHGGIGDFWVVKLGKSSGEPEINRDELTTSNENILSVYPNPAARNFMLNINMDAGFQSAIIQVLNEMGQVVFDKVLPVENGNLQTEIELYKKTKAGEYFVVATIGNKRYSMPVMIK